VFHSSFLRSLQELQRLQAKAVGERISAPAAVDVDVNINGNGAVKSGVIFAKQTQLAMIPPKRRGTSRFVGEEDDQG